MNEEKVNPTCLFVAQFLEWAVGTKYWHTLLPLIAYRGHANKNWELLPTLCRQKMVEDKAVRRKYLKQCEEEIIREYRARYNLENWTDMEVLAYARHSGAPTRLLDWSRNPLIGLWFAVSEKNYDSQDGFVYQLSYVTEKESELLSMSSGAGVLDIKHADNLIGECKKPIHLFASPPRVKRTEKQQSVFTIVSFNSNLILQPLDEVRLSTDEQMIRKFIVPSARKASLRRLLSLVGLDAYAIYGDADSLGKSLTNHFEI